MWSRPSHRTPSWPTPKRHIKPYLDILTTVSRRLPSRRLRPIPNCQHHSLYCTVMTLSYPLDANNPTGKLTILLIESNHIPLSRVGRNIASSAMQIHQLHALAVKKLASTIGDTSIIKSIP